MECRYPTSEPNNVAAIAMDAAGRVTTPFVSAGMKRAVLYADGRVVSEVFAPDEPDA